eukprot:scaffold101106_cov56-Phaeocystis_antarctica.AAC.5
MCRDAELVEFYMKTVQFHPDAWTFIFYTGERTLVLGARPDNPRLKVITGRPDLEALILGIIDNAESDIPMCPKLMQRARESERSIFDKSTEQHFCDALERALVTYSYNEIYAHAINFSAPVNGMPPPQVDMPGFIKMIRSVCRVEGDPGDGMTDDDLACVVKSFEIVDAVAGNGGLNRDEVEKVVEILRRTEEFSFNKRRVCTLSTLVTPPRSDRRRRSTKDFRRTASLKDVNDKGERKWMLSGWQMMYCGGAKPVVDTLEAIHEKYKLPLQVESYAW